MDLVWTKLCTCDDGHEKDVANLLGNTDQVTELFPNFFRDREGLAYGNKRIVVAFAKTPDRISVVNHTASAGNKG